MSLAGCVSQSDGVPEVSPADRPTVSINFISIDVWNVESTSGNTTSGWTNGFNITFHYTAHDWYSNISEVGVDIDLDGELDTTFPEYSGIETIFIPFNDTHAINEYTRAMGFRLGAVNELGIWSNDPTTCLLYTSPSPRDRQKSRMPSSA